MRKENKSKKESSDFMNEIYDVGSGLIVSDDLKIVSRIVDPYIVITTGLNSLRINSKNSFNSYKNVIDSWFEYCYGINSSRITKEIVESFNYPSVQEYIGYLQSKKNSNKTINTKLSILRSMTKWFLKHGYKVNPSIFEPMVRLRGNNDNSYVPFTEDELWLMVERAKEYENGVRKSLLIRMAFDTGIRKSALLSLKRENFFIKDNGSHWVWVYDKGHKKDEKPVNSEIYSLIMDELLERFPKSVLFHNGKDKTKPMSTRSVDRLIMQLKKDLKIKDEKKKFHGIKKTGMAHVGRLSGYDPNIMRKYGNHTNVMTTIEYYSNTQNSEKIMSEFVESSGLPDLSILNNVTKAELLKVISESSPNLRTELVALVKEYKYKKK